MDAERFDTLARSLTVAGSRRDAVVATLGSALGIVLGASSIERAEAKKKPCPPLQEAQAGQVQEETARWDGLRKWQVVSERQLRRGEHMRARTGRAHLRWALPNHPHQ